MFMWRMEIIAVQQTSLVTRGAIWRYADHSSLAFEVVAVSVDDEGESPSDFFAFGLMGQEL